MTNLLEETMMVMNKYGYKPEHVDWVGSRDGMYAISWEEFEKIASIVNYDDSRIGSQEIAKDLVIVFHDNSWLERREYDGYELWVCIKVLITTIYKALVKRCDGRKRWGYIKFPTKYYNAKPFKNVCVRQVIDWGETLSELNGKPIEYVDENDDIIKKIMINLKK